MATAKKASLHKSLSPEVHFYLLEQRKLRKAQPGLSPFCQKVLDHPSKFSDAELLALYNGGLDFSRKYRKWFFYYFRFVEINGLRPSAWPKHWPAHEKDLLRAWIGSQRKNKSVIGLEKIRLLNRHHFNWAIKPRMSFLEFVKRLRAFKRRFGHCRIPIRWKEDRHLSHRVFHTRQTPQNLTSDQKKVLNRLGFDWKPFEGLWNRQLSKLKAFRKKHGHCLVKDRCKEDRGLGLFVSNLRMRKHKISQKRRRELDALGFVWDARQYHTQIRVQELLDFKRRFGHIRVPAKWPENHGLASWLWTLRNERRKSRSRALDILRKHGVSLKTE